MKLIIASDIHGSAYWCGKLMELVEEETPDKLILLGDLLYHGPRNDLPKDYAPKQVIPMLSKYKEKSSPSGATARQRWTRWFSPSPAWRTSLSCMRTGSCFT